MKENWENHWKDYYQILQIQPSAEPEVIKGAHDKLALKYHPDVSKDATATPRMKDINEAYEILGDPEKRKRYNLAYFQRMGKSGPDIPPPPYSPPPPAKPKPEVNPTIIRFLDVIPEEIRKSSFIVKNSGGPYSKIWLSNTNTWLNISQKLFCDSGKLPLFVEIEVKGDDWGKTYVDNIIIKLDDIETHVRVELTTRAKVEPSNQPLPVEKTNPPTSGSGNRTKRGRGLLDQNEDNNEDFVSRSSYSEQPITESKGSSLGWGGILVKIAIPLFIISLLCTVLIYFHITSRTILPAQVLSIPQYPPIPTTTQPIKSIPAFITLPFNVNKVIIQGGTPNYITVFVTPNSVTQPNTKYGIQLNNRSTGTFRSQIDAAWSPADIQVNKQLALVITATQDEISKNPIVKAYWDGYNLSAQSADFSVNYTFSLAYINNLTEQQTINQQNQQLSQQYQQELAQYQQQYASISAQQQSIKEQQNTLNTQYSQKVANRNSDANKILFIFVPIDVILLLAIIYASIHSK
jgi:DnaJ domain